MDKWIATAVGLMHINKITQIQVAKKMGVTNDYVNMILNGKMSPKNAEERIMRAIDEILAERGDTNTQKSILERQER